MTRILGIGDVRRLLTLEDAIPLQRAAFLALAEGRTAAAPNSWLRLPGERRGWLKLLAGYDEASGGLGVKVLARFPGNPPGRNLGSLLLLFDERDGAPLAVMDAVYITAVRTAAGAVVATEALARPEPRTIGIVGSGVLAWYTLAAHRLVFGGLVAARVYSRSRARREAFARRAADELGIATTAVDTVMGATDGADVVVTATNSPEPVVAREHLQPGQHVAAVGIRTELDPGVLAACWVIGDGREETLHDGKFSVALAAGAVAEPDLGPDLGAVLAGAPGRRGVDEITLFDSSGVAIQDIVCAMHVCRAAEAEGAGTIVDLVADERLVLGEVSD